jgi:hypothetical protein
MSSDRLKKLDPRFRDALVPVSFWRLVPTKAGESARWESVDHRWIAVTIMVGADMGKVAIVSSDGRQSVVGSYEEALRLAALWRAQG